MKVFLCWSGELSKGVASELHGWLPDVIQSTEPFFSDDNIAAGTPWFERVEDEIKDTYFGILCVTRSNKHSHWIHYEAGGLRKGIGESRVVPLLIDLESTELEQPLAAFQNVGCDEEGLRRLVHSINDATGEKKLSSERVNKYFDTDIKQFLDCIEEHKHRFEAEQKAEPDRTTDDKVDEVLALTRQMQKVQQASIPYMWTGGRPLHPPCLRCGTKARSDVVADDRPHVLHAYGRFHAALLWLR